ncbi:hypothetical protein V8C42DRAFT_94511 [Trichoderma barbatum]
MAQLYHLGTAIRESLSGWIEATRGIAPNFWAIAGAVGRAVVHLFLLCLSLVELPLSVLAVALTGATLRTTSSNLSARCTKHETFQSVILLYLCESRHQLLRTKYTSTTPPNSAGFGHHCDKYKSSPPQAQAYSRGGETGSPQVSAPSHPSAKRLHSLVALRISRTTPHDDVCTNRKESEQKEKEQNVNLTKRYASLSSGLH